MQLVPGFALNEEARRHTYAESGSLSYGLSFRLRLLSTPPRSDAVSFSYIVVTSYGMDFHLADKAPSRTHSFPRRREPIAPCHMRHCIDSRLRGNDNAATAAALNAAQCPF